MKRFALFLIISFLTLKMTTCDIEIEIISPNRLGNELGANEINRSQLSEMIDIGNQIANAEKERRIMDSLGGIFRHGKNMIKPRQHRSKLEEINPQFFGPIIGSSIIGKPSFEIEIIKQRPRKNLNVDNKPLPGRAISKLDGVVQRFFDSFTNSIMSDGVHHTSADKDHKKNNETINISSDTDKDSEFVKLEKKFDNFFNDSSSSVNQGNNTNIVSLSSHKNNEVESTKFIEVSNKKVPIIFHNNTTDTVKDNQETIVNKEDEENKKKNEESSTEVENIITKIKNSTWYKDINSKKIVSVSLKYLTYFIVGLIIFLILYSCFVSASSKAEPPQKEKYGVDEIEDELESINKSRSSSHKFY